MELDAALSDQKINLDPMGEFSDARAASLSLGFKCIGPFDLDKLSEIYVRIQSVMGVANYSHYSITQRGGISGISERGGGNQFSSVIGAFAASPHDTAYVLTRSSLHQLSNCLQEILAIQESC